jgi:HK97 family phage major capsid protein
MKTLSQFLEAKSLTKEAFDGLKPEEQVKMIEELNVQNAEAYKSLEAKADATAEEIVKAKEEFNAAQMKHINQVNDILKNQGYALKKLVDENSKVSKDANSLADSLKENEENLKLLANKNNAGQFTVKAPATMLISSNVSGGNVPVEQRLAGLNTIASRRLRLLDILTFLQAGSNTISWVYQANKDGAAGQTAEGATKNQIDFDIVVNSETVKKTTAYIKVSLEMLNDIAFMESEINNELTRELLKAVEAQIYSGDGLGNNLNGIRTVSTAFTGGSAAGTVDNANEVDVLAAAALQIEEADQEAPDYHLVNPATLYAIKSLKVSTSDRRYVEYNNRITMEGGMTRLDGIPIISSTLVTAGQYLTGYFPFAPVYQKGDPSISFGLENDDFTKNLVTVLAEWRGLVLVRNNDRTAFVAGVFATDKATLETP